MELELSQIEDLFIETSGDLAASVSINRIVGQLYALLYIRKDPVSLDEMVEKLNVSKGNVSVNIRVLENWQAVKKVWVKGSRKDYYTAETDFLKVALTRLNEGLNRRIHSAGEKLEEIKKILDTNSTSLDKNLANFYKMRLKQLEELRTMGESFLRFLPVLSSMKQISPSAILGLLSKARTS